MLYAIGEIILVVIGIIIALQINIWNEQRKTENRIKAILKEVQKDLEEDILKSKELFEYYMERDSIIQLAINNKLTREDYLASYKYDLIWLVADAYHLKIHSNGYQSLTENLDDVPEKFQAVFAPLNEIYTYDKYEIDKFDTRLDKITDRMMDDLAANKSWFYHIPQDSITDALIDYYLDDPFYKNMLVIYSNTSSNLRFQVELFNNNAIRVYNQMAEFTGYPAEYPEHMPHHEIDVTTSLKEEVIGNYTLVKFWNKDGVVNETKRPFTLQFNAGCLQLYDVMNDYTHDLYFKNDTTLYAKNIDALLIRNNENQVIGIKGNYFKEPFEMIRNED